MAYPNYSQYPQHGQQLPPVQTQNLGQHQHQRAFSPTMYQHSPTVGSPNMAASAIHSAKRQRLSPNPPSPALPFHASHGNSSHPSSPYTAAPQASGYYSAPMSPVSTQPPPFHQPQLYQHGNSGLHPSSGSMPPPKMPYSKTSDAVELEKANARDLDVNNISDVLTGSGIDLRVEEDNLLHNYRSFNSQTSNSTVSPHISFNNWTQQSGHGAFQGTGPLSQPLSQEQHELEFVRKHEQAARILNESAQQPLTDPFLAANVLRHRIAKRAYEHGIQVNVDGLFDKIPDKTPRDITRVTQSSVNGEQVVGLEAASLLNQNAAFVEILSFLSLAAEERIRGIVEDSFALSQGRQNTSHGIVPPQLLEMAVVEKGAEPKMVTPVNLLKTPWETLDGTISPTTASKQLSDAARLPTPPSEAPPTPQHTFKNINHIALALERRMKEDEMWEKERIQRRQKRQRGTSATPIDTPLTAVSIPEPLSKKAQAAAKKQNLSDEFMFGKANETASMALGGKKKKYSWMTGGGGPGSGASTPRLANTVGGNSAAALAALPVEKGLVRKKRSFGSSIEETDIGAKIQIRDLVHVLENDGRARKTLSLMLARMRTMEKDGNSEMVEHEKKPFSVIGR